LPDARPLWRRLRVYVQSFRRATDRPAMTKAPHHRVRRDVRASGTPPADPRRRRRRTTVCGVTSEPSERRRPPRNDEGPAPGRLRRRATQATTTGRPRKTGPHVRMALVGSFHLSLAAEAALSAPRPLGVLRPTSTWRPRRRSPRS